MSKAAAAFLVGILCIALGWGILRVFDASFETGGMYPDGSTLRKDPSGASVLFDSLSRMMPATERSYLPLDRANWAKRTFIALDVTASQLSMKEALDFQTVERLARNGNRMVIALDKSPVGPAFFQFLEAPWGLKFQKSGTDEKPLLRFQPGPSWTVLRGNPDEAEVIERPLGRGWLVLAADTELFTNGGLATSHDPDLLAAVVGDSDGIVFDEAHLGIVQSGSVMALLTGFRLQGLLFGLLLVTGLVVWKFSFSFPPVPAFVQERGLEGRRSSAGLIALLRRNLSTADLVQASWQEWLKGTPHPPSPDRRRQAEEELRNKANAPLAVLRKIHEILTRRKSD